MIVCEGANKYLPHSHMTTQFPPHFQVYWDLQNCSYPKNYTLLNAIENIKFFANKKPINVNQIKIYGKKEDFDPIAEKIEKKEDKFYLKEANTLPNNGIEIIKNSNPMQIVLDIMCAVIDKLKGIILITTNEDFKNTLFELKARNCFCILVGSPTKKWVSAANHCVHWSKLVRNLPDSGNNIIVDENSFFSDTPVNPEDLIENSLSYLLEQKVEISKENLKYEMQSKNTSFEYSQLESSPNFNEKVIQFQEEQNKLSNKLDEMNWEAVPLNVMCDIYNTIKKNEGKSMKNKYLLAKLLQKEAPKQYPLGQILQIVNFAFSINLIDKSNTKISDNIPEKNNN